MALQATKRPIHAVGAETVALRSWAERTAGLVSARGRSDGLSPNFNGRPTLTFDGIANLLRYAGELTAATKGCCVMIFRFVTLASPLDVIFGTSDEATLAKYGLLYKRTGADGGTPCFEITNGLNRVFISHVFAAATNYLWITQSDDSSYAMRLNRTAYAINVDTGADDGDWFGNQADRDNFIIAAWKGTLELYQANIEVAEILLYDRDLTASELQRIENYSNFYYGA
jgi:hypothetical protein